MNNIPVNAQDIVRIHNESAVVANGVISVQRQVDLLNERQVVQAGQIQQIHQIVRNQHGAIQNIENAVQIVAGAPDAPNYMPPPIRPR